MRYTTVIDLTEFRQLYKNKNAVLVYFHLALKSGWHDHDRDILEVSVRNLAYDTGLSVAAVRHALKILEDAKLLSHVGSVWTVVKWVMTEEPTKRARNSREAKQIEVAAERKRAEEKRELEAEIERTRRAQLLQQGKTSFMVWYESQLKLAEAGDEEAKRTVERHRKMYEQQRNLVSKKETK